MNFRQLQIMPNALNVAGMAMRRVMNVFVCLGVNVAARRWTVRRLWWTEVVAFGCRWNLEIEWLEKVK